MGGLEGRCTSICVPAVAEQAEFLPQDVCPANQLCSPCCDPFSGESTGACSTTDCDPGPAEACGEPAFPVCCADGQGHCVAPDLVPEDKVSYMKECDGGNLCVPDAMQDLSYQGAPCVGFMWLGGEYYQGVCLPQCLVLPEFFIDENACPAHHTCVPCTDPFGGSTGAPGC